MRKVGEEVVGASLRVKVGKNKLAPPFKTVELELDYGRGISREAEIIDLGVKQGFVQKKGAWYSYGDLRLGQGKDKAKEYLRSEEGAVVMRELEEKLLEALYGVSEDEEVATDVEDHDVSNTTSTESGEQEVDEADFDEINTKIRETAHLNAHS